MTNKTALVTGSTSGFGEAVARRLGKMGAIVIVHGLDSAFVPITRVCTC